MKTLKKVSVIFLLALAVFSTVACTKKASTTAQAKKEQIIFGYTCMTLNNPFFVAIENTVRQEVESRGDKLITADPQQDAALQINQIDDLISQGIKLIFLNAVDWEGIRPALIALNNAGVTIVNFNAEVKDLDLVATYVGSDNKNAGKVCGEDLVKRLPGGGNIIILENRTAKSVFDRVEGFTEAIQGHGFNILAQQDARGNLQLAMDVAEDLLQVHASNTVAIFGGNDPMALGAFAATKSAGINNILIYGVDGSPSVKQELVKDGSPIVGTGAQSPMNMARLSVEVGYKLLNGESVDKRYPVPTFLITKDNVSQYGTDGWQ